MNSQIWEAWELLGWAERQAELCKPDEEKIEAERKEHEEREKQNEEFRQLEERIAPFFKEVETEQEKQSEDAESTETA